MSGSQVTRKALYGIAILLGTALSCLVILELAVRQLGWLSSYDPGNFDQSTGLPAARLEQKLMELRAGDADVIFIGDSFVETGELEGGWLQLLRKDFKGKLFGLGFSGASPSQYAFLLDRARQLNKSSVIVLIIYVGNDLMEHIIWQSTENDGHNYMAVRHSYFSDPSSAVFWPCFDLSGNDGWLSQRFVTYRNLIQLLSNKLYARAADLDRWEELARLQRSRCAKPPFAEEFGGRLFFFRDHEALVGPEARDRTLAALADLFRPVVSDKRVAFVVLFDREENCRNFHGRNVASARAVIGALVSLGLDVLNPNDVFAAACSERDLYLPDRHWNGAGHAVFAQWMQGEFGRLLPPASRSGLILPGSGGTAYSFASK